MRCNRQLDAAYGCSSMVKSLKSVLVKHPRDAFISQRNIADQWPVPGWATQLGPPDFDRALKEFEYFIGLLKSHIPDIRYLPRDDRTGIDSIYVHDPVMIMERGAILLSMRNGSRRNEPAAVEDFIHEELRIPVVGAITGNGKLEGGDMLWLEDRKLAVGRGYRTNDDGIEQLRKILADTVDDLITVPLPHWQGSDQCLHLLSLISPIDEDLAVVYSKLLPIPFREGLLEAGMKLIEVPDDEFETMGCNVLTVSPRKCIVLAGNPKTKRMLESEGAEVSEFKGSEICIKGEGGPTCLTRPILRE